MKVIFSVTFQGVEFAVSENVDYLIKAIDPTILDKCFIDIQSFTKEETEE